MALLRAFERQRAKKECPACSMILPNGRFQQHVKNCIISSTDEDCMVIETLSSKHEEQRRIVDDDSRVAFEQPSTSYLKPSSHMGPCFGAASVHHSRKKSVALNEGYLFSVFCFSHS
ncbi:hypothetical protein AB6A40_011077 [Gnathostoma spinigerum]|uniref:Uncharacterized protein n=1 Tax=Gnathostoma spinigerum TaxID=75299 RepID=A0ABD6EWM9_9BILA